MAYNPLTMILGGMLADETFRTAMTDNTDAALESYGIELTAEQREAVGKLVQSVQSGLFEASIETVEDTQGCPNWPCPLYKLSTQ